MVYTKEQRKAYRKKWYEANKDKVIARVRINNKRYVERYKALKHNKPCADCGKVYPHYVMDFDHKDSKTREVSLLATCSIKRLEEEIAKCDLVCANCHRERTYGSIA